MGNRVAALPIFIQSNTDEIRQKLNDFGYTYRSRISHTSESEKKLPYIFCYRGSWICGDNKLKEAIEAAEKSFNPNFEFFDCGDNQELFLALAAYTDAHDQYQWFTNKLRWRFCEDLKWNGSAWFKKATPKQIIKKFKK